MASHIKILFLGDIFGEPGRRALSEILPQLKKDHNPDLIFANCENAANGRGISNRLVSELLALDIDFFTSGNHIFQVKDIYSYLSKQDAKIIRPYNFPKGSPGRGIGIVESKNGVRVGVINLMGNLFIQPPANIPFESVNEALADLENSTDITVVDFHAEATSEKRAMGWHLDGRAQLLVGTHTHVLTADEEILPGGTAFITDIGMCGPYDSVIGMDKDIVLHKFRYNIPQRFEVAKNDVRITGVICEIDVDQRKATKITRIDERL